MNKQKIPYVAIIEDFLSKPIVGFDNLHKLEKEKKETEYQIYVVCLNWQHFKADWAYLLVQLLVRKSEISFLTSRLLFPKNADVSEQERVETFLSLVYEAFSQDKKEGKQFRKILKGVLLNLWQVLECDIIFNIKNITFLDVDGLCVTLSKAKIGVYNLIFPSSILKRKKEEILWIISHELSHTLQPEDLKMDRQQFANSLATQLMKEIAIREGNFEYHPGKS